MTRDVYNRLAMNHAGSFSADSAVITFGGKVAPDGTQSRVDGVGLLTQQINWQYMQQVTRLYEVGTNNTYYVVGRTQGNAGMARVLGPRRVSLAFYATYGDACKAPTNVLNFSANTGCEVAGGNAGGFVISMTGVLIQSIAGSVRAEDMLVSEQLSLMFVAMLISEAPAAIVVA